MHRYALAYPPSDVRQRLIEYGMPVDEEAFWGDIQPGYNIAPGNTEPVYRAIEKYDGGGNGPDAVDRLAEDGQGGKNMQGSHDKRDEGLKYVLEPMKWGLIPSWTKRTPDFDTLVKTINCRDDSLLENKGMWTSMKHKKRCIIVAQGYYEWLKKGKQKLPYFVKRKDEKLLCMAGLWDCVQYEGSTTKIYTYTIITTSSNPQLKFLHERMPVILDPGSEDINTWLSPATSWNTTLQSLLKPYGHELDVYPVVKEVGNRNNNSPTFIVPLDSKDNKANIKNFFTSPSKKEEIKVKIESEVARDIEVKKSENSAPQITLKRRREDDCEDVKSESSDITPPSSKNPKIEDSSTEVTGMSATPWVRSATSNAANRRGPPSSKKKSLKNGTPRITNFFRK